MSTIQTRSVLITGASSGLGSAIAKALADEEHRVYGTGRSWQTGEEIEGLVRVRMDVLDESSIGSALAFVHEKEGSIDVLINNAGIGIQGAAEDLSVAEAKRAFDTNFFGLHAVTQAALPYMRDKRFGRIINISSIAANMGLPYRGFYSASKAAVDKYSEALNMEMGPWNICVSCIEPGDFKSNIAASRVKPDHISDAHRKGYEQCMSKLDVQMAHAKPPTEIVRAVSRLIESESPTFRKRVGKPLEKLAVHLRYWLPAGTFQSMLKRFSE